MTTLDTSLLEREVAALLRPFPRARYCSPAHGGPTASCPTCAGRSLSDRARSEAILNPRPAGSRLARSTSARREVRDGSQLPLLLAVVEVLVGPQYGVEHSGNTTGADALIILNGPIVSELSFNHGPGAMRDGAGAANTVVARWLRLFLRNVRGFTADQHDKATLETQAGSYSQKTRRRWPILDGVPSRPTLVFHRAWTQ